MRRMIVGLCGILSAMFIFGPAWAQFSPGEQWNVGSDTHVGLVQLGPGKVSLEFTNINVNYIDGVGMPSGVKPHLVEPDVSRKGTSNIVNVASSQELSKQFVCLRGEGTDWEKQACGPISVKDGITRASVVLDVSPTLQKYREKGLKKNMVFGVTPTLNRDTKELSKVWVTHPIETRMMVECKERGITNMMSVFVLQWESGQIDVASASEREGYRRLYEKHICPNLK